MKNWIASLEGLLKILISPLEWIMLLAVIGGGLFLVIHSRGYPLLKIKTAFKLLFSKKKAREFLVFKHFQLFWQLL
jgi:Na+/alanine symporter